MNINQEGTKISLCNNTSSTDCGKMNSIEVSESRNGLISPDINACKAKTNHVTFQRIYKVVYLGYAVLDRRYTLPMLPWVIAEIKRYGAQNAEDIFLEVTESCLKAKNNVSNKMVFEHKLTTISKFAQTAQDQRCFTYMTREIVSGPCAYHVFQASDECTVLELFTTLREMSKEMSQSQQFISPIVSKNSTISLDTIMSSGQHYEVLYLGRIKVTSKRAPPSFIDDAVDKFRLYELEKMRAQQNLRSDSLTGFRQRHGSGNSITSLPHMLDSLQLVKENQLSCQSKYSPSLPKSSSQEYFTPNSTESSSENSRNSSLDEINRERSNSSSSDVFHSPCAHLFESPHSLKSPTLSLSSTLGLDEESSNSSLQNKNNLLQTSSFVPHTQSLDAPSTTAITNNLHNLQTELLRGRVRSCSGDIPRATKQMSLPAYRTRVGSGGSSDMRRPRAFTSPVSSISPASSPSQQVNRTMLFLIGKLELCLIGMDKKQVLLSKTFNDIAHCSQGVRYLDHFGFICRETTLAGADCYAGYIFRCQTEQVVDEIMQSLKLAFQKAHQDYQHNGLTKSPNIPKVTICETCPMQWFHKLCSDVDGLPPEKSHCNILIKLHTLAECDRDEILLSCDAADVNSLQEQNEVIMMLLRKFCEQKQIKHIHINNGNNQKTDYTFMKEKSASSKLNDFRQKAKKSLSSSFETFLKLKNRDDSRDRSSADNILSPMRQSKSDVIEEGTYREGSYDERILSSADRISPIRPRSSTFSSTREVRKNSQKRAIETKKKDNGSTKSPIMNIFMKVGNTDRTPTSSGDEAEPLNKKGSWRQAIFHRVQTPVQTPKKGADVPDGKMNNTSSDEEEKTHIKKTGEQLRALWKKAILEQILLIRMEKENKKLQVSQDAATHKRMKLDYEDITPCLKDIAQKWENLLICTDKTVVHKENLFDLVKTGIPRNRRGEIWQFLAQQYNFMWGASTHLASDSDISTPYEELIRQLTSHQHSILIDLGRTFPSHPFYCQPLGPGQLALFNLLKAYSLLDKEVGYCQGLSFVAGILLLHMPEERAFHMMKHILFRLGLRRQYKPDMVALQIQMYQLSRLMHDNHREVYDHLEKYDIAPTLYAAPWFLTLYASQFPLGFVSRLFDILFLQGVDVIFKVAMVLIGNHKDRILQCHGFEAIMECLKTSLPSMNAIEMERVFQQVFSLDIHKQLHAYEVEYHVLREEMMFSPSKSDTEIVRKLETANRNLKIQNMELMEQLQVAYSTIDHLEASETSYKSTVQKLETRINGLDDENDALRHSLNVMKKRLQKLEKACLDSNDASNTTHAILDTNHTPSFQVVYAGSEKEENEQFKSFVQNFCNNQHESVKDSDEFTMKGNDSTDIGAIGDHVKTCTEKNESDIEMFSDVAIIIDSGSPVNSGLNSSHTQTVTQAYY